MLLAPGACATPPAVTAPPAVGFSATEEDILEGEATTLLWIVTDAASVQIDQGIGSVVPTVGSVLVSPASDTTYILTASNSVGIATQSVTIKVTSPTPLNIPSLRKITLKPMGDVDQNILDVLQERLEKIFGCPVEIANEYYPLDAAYVPERQQYKPEVLLSQLDKVGATKGEKVLGIIDSDLYSEGENIVLGEAMMHGPVSVISVSRLRVNYLSRLSSEALLLNRATKTAVHELGHTLGAGHCLNPKCPMYYSAGETDTDYKQAIYCDVCRFTIER